MFIYLTGKAFNRWIEMVKNTLVFVLKEDRKEMYRRVKKENPDKKIEVYEPLTSFIGS